MQEWLKNKKNLPIVVALAVFMMLAAGGLIAFELGAFSGSGVVATVPPATGIPPGIPGPPPGTPGPPGEPGPSAYPQGGRPGLPQGAMPITPGAAAVVKKSTVLNPLIGPDPFKIPGGAKKEAEAQLKLLGPKPAIRDQIGPLNLFQIHPTAPPVPPALPDGVTAAGGGVSPTANYRLAGVVTGSDGINAILEVGDQSQTVKPGDTLPDGTQVQNIQTNSITLRTALGATVNLPLSAGTPDPGNGYNGPGQYPGGQYPGGQYPGGQFQPGGFGARPPF